MLRVSLWNAIRMSVASVYGVPAVCVKILMTKTQGFGGIY